MAKDPKKVPGALDTPLEEPKEPEEEQTEDTGVEEIEQSKGDATPPAPEANEIKGKVRKIILKGDNPKILYAVKNTGVNDIGVNVATDKAGKAIARVQHIFGKEVKIGSGETIVVSQNIKRFFSKAKGYDVESYKG